MLRRSDVYQRLQDDDVDILTTLEALLFMLWSQLMMRLAHCSRLQFVRWRGSGAVPWAYFLTSAVKDHLVKLRRIRDGMALPNLKLMPRWSDTCESNVVAELLEFFNLDKQRSRQVPEILRVAEVMFWEQSLSVIQFVSRRLGTVSHSIIPPHSLSLSPSQASLVTSNDAFGNFFDKLSSLIDTLYNF